MGRQFDTISFLSDLGVVDEHVGVVKSVVRDMAPHVQVIDLTHHIAPYDVRAGSLALARAVTYLPSGVVLALVDVGDRRPVAVEVAGGKGVLLGPDNGLLASAVAMVGGAERAVVLDREEFHLVSPGGTLASRDVFAPVAAHLCNGTDLEELGTIVDAATILPGVVPLARDFSGVGSTDEGIGVHAEVLWIDHLGNCQLNIGLDDVAPWGVAEGTLLQVTAGDQTRSVLRVSSAAALGPGAIGVLVDGSGLLTLVLDRRSAADELSLAAADQVTVQPGTESGNGAVSVPINLRR
ncbi:MAG: SAM-dependent chlorinase/fluorinase [Actinomycetia bacterium]|nr:SAM-dependent chlorinase/fluorinase [Actinomycetes bacterium]